MEITITLGRGESLQDVLRKTKFNPVGPLTLKLNDGTVSVVPDAVKPTVKKPAGKKRGRPKGRKDTKPRKTRKPRTQAKRKIPLFELAGKRDWTKKESIWMANQPRPSQAKTAKLGRTKVSELEAAFAHKFGYRRTYKSLMSKWNRMQK